MISMTLHQAADVLHGELYGQNLTFNTVSTDTRKIIAGSLFIALKGKNFDAHNFIEEAKNAGASALLINRRLKIGLPQIIVKDTRLALSELARWVRKQVSARVVALTGSSGKTSVKEIAAAILSLCGNTLYTLDNLNNEIGISMTLLRLVSEHKYAVIELGASHQGEIASEVSLIHPEVALVNNVAPAHLEGFGSLQGVAKAKGEIYSGLQVNGTAIINADNNDWSNWKYIIGDRQTWRFSLDKKNNDFTATNIQITSYGTKFMLQTPIGDMNVLLPLIGRHSIANALAAAALSIGAGATLEAVKTGFKRVKAIPGRLFPILLGKNKLLLDDSYNSNVGSMIVAMQVLSEMPGFRVLVVGDMAELGEASEAYHFQVGKTAKELGIDCILSIGRYAHNISRTNSAGKHFTDKKVLLVFLKKILTAQKTITVLVKGSRNIAMEEIVQGLQKS